jgi:arylsulfatase A-like enzyme
MVSRAAGLRAGFLLLAALGSCASAPARPNVLLIVIDTLRADHLGCYGDPEARTPSIDAVAGRSAQFRCVSQAPWTTPATATILSGLFPAGHGANRPRQKIPESVPLLAEAFRDGGWRTGAVVSHSLVGRHLGFARGFDAFDQSNAGGHDYVSSDSVTALATAWVDSSSGPFFLFVHYFDAHYNYLEHEGFTRPGDYQGRLEPGMDIWEMLRMHEFLGEEDMRYVRRLYRGEISYLDAALHRLFRHLEERGLLEGTAVVLTADHGEEFLEHGWIGHTRSLHDVALDIPLLVHGPGVDPGARPAKAMQVDVRPTVLGLAGIDGATTPGVDLSRVEPGPRTLYSEVTYDAEALAKQNAKGRQDFRKSLGLSKSADQRALESDGWKVIEDRLAGRWHLFDLTHDPGEKRDLATDRPDLLERMKQLLAATDAGAPGPAGEQVPISDEEREKLRALGYVD